MKELKGKSLEEYIAFANDHYQEFNSWPMEFEDSKGNIFEADACLKAYKENKYKIQADKNGFINFGDVARERMNQQCQYACRYFCKRWETVDYKYLGEGLRIQGNSRDYHSMKIHKDDIEIAVKRYLDKDK